MDGRHVGLGYSSQARHNAEQSLRVVFGEIRLNFYLLRFISSHLFIIFYTINFLNELNLALEGHATFQTFLLTTNGILPYSGQMQLICKRLSKQLRPMHGVLAFN